MVKAEGLGDIRGLGAGTGDLSLEPVGDGVDRMTLYMKQTAVGSKGVFQI